MEPPVQSTQQALRIELPATPAWVGKLLGSATREIPEVPCRDWVLRTTQSPEFAVFRAILADAVSLDDASLCRAVEHLYAAIGPILRDEALYPLRFWNYIPEICRRTPGGLNRYEVFNSGRFAGYRRWPRSGDLGKWIATASAVGHRGDDLVVDVLAGRKAGTPVENPRQRPSYEYSRRYGPRPPCFSRAMSLDAPFAGEFGRWAIVGGTASVVGEDSQHPADLAAQQQEIHLNLASLSAAIFAGPSPCSPSSDLDGNAVARNLGRYRELRAYVPDDAHAEEVIANLRRAFPNSERLEIASADMCRSELLIEVEGIVSSGE
jgi:chorismate lyase/3-hydroxybenzoate synthase